MAGIYGLLTNKKHNIEHISSYFYSSRFENIINEEFKYENFLYGRSVIPKFLDDRVLYEDNEVIIGFEGVFFNKESKKSYDTLKKWYLKEGKEFVKKIEGQFSGFIYDKALDKLLIFNDHLSSKPLYFFKVEGLFIFASELKVITRLMSELKIKKELDYDAVYSMLTFGYMLENITYEKNIKKLDYATILEIDKNFNRIDNKYFKYRKSENVNLSKKEIIETIDKLLENSVRNCWEKDDEYNYKHYSFLSGGLDSRTNIFLAKELGYEDILTITFAESSSADAKIAQEITNKENFSHLFYALDNGKFLEENLAIYTESNDGLNGFNGSAAGYSVLSVLNHKDYGALHTGQIGDLLFGSYVKDYFDVKSGVISSQVQLLEKISFFNGFSDKYKNNSELFGYEQKVIGGTLNGDRTSSHFVDMISPFYDKKLIQFCLSIPDKFKKNESIYMDWFNIKHTNISKYKWESVGVKPKNLYFVLCGKQIKRYKNALFRRLGLSLNNMNPFESWLKRNQNILKSLDLFYNKNIEIIGDNELKILLQKMYDSDIRSNHLGRNNKFLALTFLMSYRQHFEDK